MLKPNSLPKTLILRRKIHVGTLFCDGHQHLTYPVKLTVVNHPHEANAEQHRTSENGVGIIFLVPKRLHKRAVVRNILRRRMREALRLNKALLPTNLHIALTYIAKEECDFATIQNAIIQLLMSLVDPASDSPR